MKYYSKVKQITNETIESAKKIVNDKLPGSSKKEEKQVALNGADSVNGNTNGASKEGLHSQAQDVMMQTLNWAYDCAINDNMPGISSISKMSEDFLKKSSTITEACNSMINWQLTYAGGMGFITNLGGLMTLPVTVPASIASVLYIQIRLVASVAYMGEYDLKSEQVRTSIFLSLLGGSANMVLESVGVKLTTKLSTNAIKKISSSTLVQINQAVGFKLVTKFGTTGILNMGKVVPVLGGLVGGTLDVLATNVIANTAKKMFLGDTIERERLDEFEILRIKALINMAKIDGHLSNEEQTLIQGIIDNSSIAESDKQNLYSLMDSRQIIDIDFTFFKKNELYGFSLLNSLISVIMIDHKIQPAERLYLKKVAKEIKISSNEILEMLDSYNINN
ncbi:MAG: DUF533 domain-containing protein [Bacteroidaceae bacterium]